MRKLVIFDVDGTLVDSQDHIVSAMNGAFSAFGLPAPERTDTLSIVGLSLPVAIAQLAPSLNDHDREMLVEGYKTSFTAGRAATLSPLYEGAADALEQLRGRDDIILGIATGKSRRGLDHIMDAHGWRQIFATVQVADNHPSKPHPSMIAACLQETGVAAQNAVMVGDTRFDMDMARAAGVQGLGVAWGYHPAQDLGPHVISDFSQLVPVLDTLWEGIA